MRDCNRPEWSFCLTRSQSSLSVLLSGARAVMGRTKAREKDSLAPFSPFFTPCSRRARYAKTTGDESESLHSYVVLCCPTFRANRLYRGKES